MARNPIWNLSALFIWKDFNSPSVLKYNTVEYTILVWQDFFLAALWVRYSTTFGPSLSDDMLASSWAVIPCHVNSCFSQTTFKIFILFFNSLTTVRLYMDHLIFVIFAGCWFLESVDVPFSIKFGEFSTMTSHTFLPFPSLLLLGLSLCVCWCPWYYLTSLVLLTDLQVFFCVFFQLKHFYLSVFMFTGPFPLCFIELLWSHSSAFFFSFFSYCTYHVHSLHLFLNTFFPFWDHPFRFTIFIHALISLNYFSFNIFTIASLKTFSTTFKMWKRNYFCWLLFFLSMSHTFLFLCISHHFLILEFLDIIATLDYDSLHLRLLFCWVSLVTLPGPHQLSLPGSSTMYISA